MMGVSPVSRLYHDLNGFFREHVFTGQEIWLSGYIRCSPTPIHCKLIYQGGGLYMFSLIFYVCLFLRLE